MAKKKPDEYGDVWTEKKDRLVRKTPSGKKINFYKIPGRPNSEAVIDIARDQARKDKKR